jgi:hypothetical protein
MCLPGMISAKLNIIVSFRLAAESPTSPTYSTAAPGRCSYSGGFSGEEGRDESLSLSAQSSGASASLAAGASVRACASA